MNALSQTDDSWYASFRIMPCTQIITPTNMDKDHGISTKILMH